MTNQAMDTNVKKMIDAWADDGWTFEKPSGSEKPDFKPVGPPVLRYSGLAKKWDPVQHVYYEIDEKILLLRSIRWHLQWCSIAAILFLVIQMASCIAIVSQPAIRLTPY